MEEARARSHLFNRLSAWLSARLTPPAAQAARAATGLSRVQRGLLCAAIFFAALGVRFLQWQDYQQRVGSDMGSLAHRYQKQAQSMLDGGGILFPSDYAQPGNVQLLVHPPGYSIFIAALSGMFGPSKDRLILAHIVGDAVCAVLVFLLALELLPQAVALLAALLVAFSPHLAHHTLTLMPDSLVVLPTLVAVWLLICASKRPRLAPVIAAGVMIGLSCWLRSNALLLAVYFAAAVWLLFDRNRRLRYALLLVGATIITIAPITIRNFVVFGKFIPLSLGSGITMVEGIGDYDQEKRFGMPVSDLEGKWKDVEWHGREDYSEGLWKPDGIFRDRYRFSRGLEVIGRHPFWFAGVMMRRAASMLRYNDSLSQGWPADTARAPIVEKEPSFGHPLDLPIKGEMVWTNTPAELLNTGDHLLSSEGVLAAGGQTLSITGDQSEFGDQFASAVIVVEQNTDYVLKVPVWLRQGAMAAKVTSADRLITLAAHFITPQREPKRKAKKQADEEADEAPDAAAPDAPSTRPAAEIDEPLTPVALMAFASGNQREVRLVISNNGATGVRAAAAVGRAELFALGPTPQLWTRAVRPLMRGVQRNVFTTAHLSPLIVIGVVLLALARRRRALLFLLIVPLYYLSVQSAFHTEYRYILAMHYFLFVAGATALYLASVALGCGARQIFLAAQRARH